MLTQEDITWLTGKGFVVQPQRAKETLQKVENITQNEFSYLENNRFLGTEFVKFPDERRQVSLNNEVFEIFGKSSWDFFAINVKNQGIYLISTEEGTPFVYQINENLRKFTIIYHYFLMSMHQIIAEQLNLTSTDEKTYTRETNELYENIANCFHLIIKPLDRFAFPDDNTPSFWQTVYHMMQEADLAFTLNNVSLFDYIKTGRFGLK